MPCLQAVNASTSGFNYYWREAALVKVFDAFFVAADTETRSLMSNKLDDVLLQIFGAALLGLAALCHVMTQQRHLSRQFFQSKIAQRTCS